MFGKRIVELRTENSMTQTEFAKSIGISRSALALYETEKREPSIETLENMAAYFNVSVDYILGRTDQRINLTDADWKYSSVSNRLGSILIKYREKNILSETTFSKQLNISPETYTGIELGKYVPSLKLLQNISKITGYDIDYLTGAKNHTSVSTDKIIEIKGHSFPVNDFEGDYHFRARFEELCLKKELDYTDIAEFLGLTKQEYIDVRWNRMPTLSELLKISYAFGVSMDYLIGKTDIKLSSLNTNELNLILNYRDCLPKYQKNIRERARDLSIESINSPVAADESLKITGTDNQGK